MINSAKIKNQMSMSVLKYQEDQDMNTSRMLMKIITLSELKYKAAPASTTIAKHFKLIGI